jgi:hypothetical protein
MLNKFNNYDFRKKISCFCISIILVVIIILFCVIFFSYCEYLKEGKFYMYKQHNLKIDDGFCITWWQNGSIRSIGKKLNGKYNGIWLFFDWNENITVIGNYKNGRKRGRWIFYDVQGKILTKGIYVEPKKTEKTESYQGLPSPPISLNELSGKKRIAAFFWGGGNIREIDLIHYNKQYNSIEEDITRKLLSFSPQGELSMVLLYKNKKLVKTIDYSK